MAIENSQQKFQHELGDIYDAEHRFLKGQQEMLQNASDPQLQQMIQEHIQQSQGQVQNLEQVFSILGQEPRAEKCDASQGLVTEAKKTMGEAQTDLLRDCVIASAAAKVEHYEIASYRGLLVGAQLMGQQQIVQLLQQNLQQEEQTAQKLEQFMPQLAQRAMQDEGMQPKGDLGMGSGAQTAGIGTLSGSATQTLGRTGSDVGRDDVIVNTSGASDILIDDTGMSQTS